MELPFAAPLPSPYLVDSDTSSRRHSKTVGAMVVGDAVAPMPPPWALAGSTRARERYMQASRQFKIGKAPMTADVQDHSSTSSNNSTANGSPASCSSSGQSDNSGTRTVGLRQVIHEMDSLEVLLSEAQVASAS